MGERRGDQPPPESGLPQPGLIAGGVRLTPVQESWGAFIEHATHCDDCRSLDAGPCLTADALYRAYQEADSEAFRRYRGTP